MAIVMRLVQRFQSAKKEEFMDLEKKFAALEHRGILPRGLRMSPVAASKRIGMLVRNRSRINSFLTPMTLS